MKKSLALLFLCFFIILPYIKVEARTASDSDCKLYNEKLAATQVFAGNNRDLYLKDEDVYLMAQVVYAESQGEPYEGKVAVASVILNRLKSPGFPKTVEGVIKQKDAFSCVTNGKISIVPDSSCYSAVLDALKGNDPTEKAVFFYNPKTATSSWMNNINKENVKNIGHHVFFVAN